MSGSSKNPSFIKKNHKRAGIGILAVILLASTFNAGHAEAGVLSLFSIASGKTITENSPTIQKMMILEVAFSPALSGRGGQDVITDESALISGDTPLGDTYKPDTQVSDDKEQNQSIRTYKVKSGDTISSIAINNGVSANTIVWANNLDRKASLKVGEVLAILPVSGIQYTVKKGDTIVGIAKKYSAEISDIEDYNNITDATLIAGEKIIVPGADLAQSPTSTVLKPKALSEKTQTFETNTIETTSPQTIPEKSDNSVDDGDNNNLVFGTLVRPKTNNGDSSSFIRPIAVGVGRKSQGTHDKWAIDIAAPIGTPIHAAAGGTVILVKPDGYNGGYGKYVAIEHDGGIQTLYAHMTTTKVVVGQVVSQGDVIGLVGSTGRSTGPHVHYEVRGAPNNCLLSCE